MEAGGLLTVRESSSGSGLATSSVSLHSGLGEALRETASDWINGRASRAH